MVKTLFVFYCPDEISHIIKSFPTLSRGAGDLEVLDRLVGYLRP
jgi:hypothetical protein